MNTAQMMAHLRQQLDAERGQKATLARWLSMIVAKMGGTLELAGGPSDGTYHLMTAHRCVGQEHGPQCSDILMLHIGDPELCEAELCINVRTQLAAHNAAPGVQVAHLNAAPRKQSSDETMMLEAEAKQSRPELN